jgi:hypothetical protein
MRLPLKLAAVMLVVAACSNFLDDLSCLGGAKCDPNKQPNTAGSCPLTGVAAGAHLGPCSANGSCNSASDACVLDTCISCGQPGQVCCDQQGATGCPGAACVKGVEDFPTCHSDCGAQGSACCPGTSDPCPISGFCDNSTQMCVADSNDPTSGGGHFVWLKTPGKCAVIPYHFDATTASDIQAKAAAHLAQVNAGLSASQQFSLGPIDTTPTEYDLCMYPVLQLNAIDPIILYAFNVLELGSCQAETAGGSTQASWGKQGPGNSCPAIPNP